MKKIYLLMLILNHFVVLSQNISYVPNTFPTTPTVQSLNKFIDYPINYSTGLVNISIPIYEIKLNDFTYPISLSYHTKGFKVEEESSNIGLGWVLNSGGVMSRTMNSIPDDLKHFEYGGFMNTIHTIRKVYSMSGNYYDSNNINLKRQEKLYDDEADIFQYSSSLLSGKFSYDQDLKKFIDIPYTSNKITPIYEGNIGDKILKWIIQDESGNKYYFGYNDDIELNNVSVISSSGLPMLENAVYRHITNWYLTYIVTKNNDTINFDYKINNKVVRRAIRNSSMANQSSLDMSADYTGISYNEINLDKIRFKNGFIKINYSDEARKDLIGSKSISEIEVYENINQEQPNRIKKIVFNQTYFQADIKKGLNYPKIANNFSYTDEDAQTKRLKLDKLHIYGGKDSTIPETYAFEYNKTNLPQKFSYSLDYFGYHNGADNDNLYPKIKFSEEFIPGRDFADRYVDSVYVKAALLEKIIFPTKGYIKYNYEPNTASFFDELTAFCPVSNPPTNNCPIIKTCDKNVYYENLRDKYYGDNSYTKLTGGVRVNLIETYDKDNTIINRKSLKYYNGSSSLPIFGLYDPFRLTTNMNGCINVYIKFDRNVLDLPGIDNTYYEKVEEISEDPRDAKKILKEYTFNPFSSYYTGNNMYLEEGVSLRKLNYTSTPWYAETMIKESNFFDISEVSIKNYGNIRNKEYSFIGGVKYLSSLSTRTSLDLHPYRLLYFNYTESLENTRIETTEIFNNSSNIENSIDNTFFYYDNFKKPILRNSITKNSKGETITTDYQYPPDWAGNPVIDKLIAQNRISEPLTIVQKNNGIVVSAIYNEYKEFNGANGIIEKSGVFQKKGSSDQFSEADRKITYNSYDEKGNLTQYTLENGIPVSIIWGYKGQYPVAKIEGVDYNTVKQLIAGGFEAGINNGDITPTSFDGLRNTLPNALITTYVYKPLIGVTSITAPNGQTEYYNYDSSNRLQSIVNENQEVLKTFEYNYKQP